MKIQVWLPALLLLLAAPAAFADIGPGPQMPSVAVDILENGKPYGGEISLSYVCTTPGASNSPVGERIANFTCSNGRCVNERWFYKFNPCFYPDNGTFVFGRNGTVMTAAGWVSFPDAQSYRFTLDIGTRALSQEGGPSPAPPTPTPPSPCPIAAVLLLPPVALCFHFRRQ